MNEYNSTSFGPSKLMVFFPADNLYKGPWIRLSRSLIFANRISTYNVDT